MSPTEKSKHESKTVVGTPSAPFPKYLDFLESIPHGANDEFNAFRRRLKRCERLGLSSLSGTIVDVNDTGRSTEKSFDRLSLLDSSQQQERDSSVRQVDTLLSQVGSDVVTRIVLVSRLDRQPRFIDLLGHRFGIEPLFFWSSICTLGGFEGDDPKEYPIPPLPARPRFLRFGNHHVKILRDFPLQRRVNIIIVILESSVMLRDVGREWDLIIAFFKRDVPGPAVESDPNSAPESSLEHRRLGVIGNFLHLLSQHKSMTMARANLDLVQFLYPLGQIFLERSRASVICLGQNFVDKASRKLQLGPGRVSSETHEKLIEKLADLRVEIDHLQTSFMKFDHYRQQILDDIHSERETVSTKTSNNLDPNEKAIWRDPEWESLMRDYRLSLGEARNTEAQIRDHMQLTVSLWSLEESRKGIEQSEKSIAESKRLKLVTILAFVFIPISLASSVFGMNIQELNSTGQPIWVFLATAIGLFVVTLAIWGTANMGQKWWRQRDFEHKKFNSKFDERIYLVSALSKPWIWSAWRKCRGYKSQAEMRAMVSRRVGVMGDSNSFWYYVDKVAVAVDLENQWFSMRKNPDWP